MTIISVPESLNSSPPLQGERVAFTGTLASMTHREAAEEVEKHGGAATSHVSRQTTMLVVGEEGWPLESDGTVSRKLEQVSEWKLQGAAVRILQESDWLRLLGLDDHSRELTRVYTPAMLSQLLRIPVGSIRRWERLGLIHPVRKVNRLPYFDFLEVSATRRLSELLTAGVSPKSLQTGLERLRTLMPEAERPLARLQVLADHSRMLVRDTVGLVEPATGQRFFDFESPAATSTSEDGPDASVLSLPVVPESTAADPRLAWTSDDWVHEGLRLSEAGETDAAIEAFRMALMDRPGDPETNFHLAEALYRKGNSAGALERYHAAVEHDHEYVEAWVQLGCVHAELGQDDAALSAFQIALRVHADYPDAHWHAASVLHQTGHTAEAVGHWQRYLEFDSRGPWAEQARQRLEENSECRTQSAERRTQNTE